MGIEQYYNFADFPQSEGNSTSSIGATWPPGETSYGRIKAVANEVIDDHQKWDRLREAFTYEAVRLEEGLSRVQFRYVCNEQMLTHAIACNAPIEAVLQLDYFPLKQRCYLVYLAQNHHSRQSHPADLALLHNHVEVAKQQPVQTPIELLSKATENGYHIEVLVGDESHGQNEYLVNQVTNLYQRFGWDRESVTTLLSNPDQLIGVAIKDEQIVSAGLIELAKVHVGNHTFRMAEITEAATLNGHTSLGLYKAVSTSLLLKLRQLSNKKAVLGGPVDLVFGECNGLSLGVLMIAAQQGRTFAMAPNENKELVVPGVLKQQVPINDPGGFNSRTGYNDLVVTYLNNGRLNELYRT